MSTRLPRIGLCLMILTMLLAGCGSGSPAGPIATHQEIATAPVELRAPREAPSPQPTAAAMPTSAPAATAGAATAAEQTVDGLPAPQPPAVEPVPVEEPPLTTTDEDRLSTFALDVDTASYTMARGAILGGYLPDPDATRVEEFVNYFEYNYAPPAEGDFAIALDAAPAPFGREGAQLVRVGIQGRSVPVEQRPDATLTFVIDVSGSMQEPNRLPLVKQALHLLVEQLRPSDQVGIVVYGSEARILLEHTGLDQKDQILAAIDSLGDEGSTNAEAGLQLGYRLAADHFRVGGINRVILCSDGVANVGETGPDAILSSIRDHASQGIYLTTVGFGMGSYNDQLMEQLANDGNGNYAYVDHLREAQRVFVENLTGTLQVIARDAKVQVEFDPAVVSAYRLLGYENRAVADEDFRNDRVDAGEIGAGHSVTAIYEVVLTGQAHGDALTVRLRYADPQSGEVRELSRSLVDSAFASDFSAAPANMQLATAAAAFAEGLRADNAARGPLLSTALEIAERVAPQLANDGDVAELLDLLRRARQLAG